MKTAEKEALSSEEINKRLEDLPEWKKVGKAIERVQTFPTFKDALDFVYQVGLAAEAEDHHPDMAINYKKVTVRYSTHTAHGITDLDFMMAAVVEGLVDRFSQPRNA